MGGRHSKCKGHTQIKIKSHCPQRVAQPATKAPPRPATKAPPRPAAKAPPQPATRTPTRPEIVEALDKDAYMVMEMIGKGNFGEVFIIRLTNPVFGGYEIVGKKMKPINATAEAIEAAAAEFEVLADLVGVKGIVEVYATDYDEKDNELWIFMEKLKPIPWDTKKKLLPPAAALAYIQQMVSSLRVVHRQKIVHADLKPENVLCDAEGCAKLVDFGVSKAVHAYIGLTMASMTGTSMTGGGRITTAALCTSAAGFTPLFAPPEQYPTQLGGNNTLHLASDIFAIGCLYVAWVEGLDKLAARRLDINMKAGPYPVINRNTSVLIDGLPPWVCQCLQLNHADRPTAADLEKMLQ